MRRGLAALTAAGCVAGGAAAAPAGAAPVTLWGCHGPAGQALGSAPFAPSAAGDGATGPFAGGCDAAAGALADGGLRAAFTRPDPAAGSLAAWQAELPGGLAVTQVRLVRRTSGFGSTPVPGGAQRYAAESADGVLESSSVEDSSDAPLDGSATFATPASGFVRVGVRCGAPASGRCAAPGSAPIGVDLGTLAVTASDDAAPRGAVGGLVSPAAGTMALTVRATDDGIGLASAQATVDGAVAATATLGGAACADLSPDDPAVDLPLGDGCPSAVTDLRLPVATTALTDGVHRLRVTVADGAGNTTTLIDQAFTVDNAPVFQQSTATLTIGTPGAAGAAGASAGTRGAGTTGAVSGSGSASAGPACRAPRLSVFLKDRPLRVARGVPVLRRGARYRFTGTLTCAVGRRRAAAPAGAVVTLANRVGGRTYRKGGFTTRFGGRLTAILSYRGARVLEFSYRSVDGSTAHVRLRIAVARAAAR